MTYGGFTLKALKANYDGMCAKVDKIWEQMEGLEPESEEYKRLQAEVNRIEANKQRIGKEIIKKGNKDPNYPI